MPRVPGEILLELLQLVATLTGNELERALRRRAAEALRGGGSLAKVIRAALLLLSDLIKQGWRVEAARGALWVTAPRSEGLPGEPLDMVKRRLRAPLLAARAAQLADPAVRAFFRKMESPRVVDRQRVSVLNLIDDGESLAGILRGIGALPEPAREEALQAAVRPSLHLATADGRCPHTDLCLLDVWRYFRHTWSLEYRPTPGRTLFLLLRNEARPFAPVMAIAALANALPQLRVRDTWIGWTPQAVIAQLNADPKSWREIRESLLRTLAEARDLIRAEDLMAHVGKANGRHLEEALLALSEVAYSQRNEDLRKRQERLTNGLPVASLKAEFTDVKGNTDWKAASESPLFMRKRAKTLAAILFADRILSNCSVKASPKDLLSQEEFIRALVIGLREIKKIGLASRLLEVIVCGAVPPYRELLAGKLMALTLASADVRALYRNRYREQASEIASKMAGRKVVRTPEVCVLTTTSLYGVAASQYNRLRIEVEGGQGPVRLEWKELGKTEGYGTVHLSETTVEALRAAAVESRGGRNVNNVFGEGNSPRLRQVREGVDAIGLDSDAILRHSAPRIVYALELYEDARYALLLNKAPRAKSPAFSEVAGAWSRRWLAMRIQNQDVLVRVAKQGVATVRAELAAPGPQLDRFAGDHTLDVTPLAITPRRRIKMPTQSKVILVQSLYRALYSCADHLDAESIDLLHIETTLERSVRTRAIEGQVVFVTGNPGDGKTFLLKRIEPELLAAKVQVCLDANEMDDSDLAKMIDSGLRRKSGLVIAINEGILVELAKDFSWAGEIRSQLLRPFQYREEGHPKDPRISVLDMNLRNNLAPSIVRSALNRLLQLCAPCSECPQGNCRGIQNVQRLSEEIVSDRLSGLLSLVARSGYHATMRDLFGFLSFVLWGGLTCRDVVEETRLNKPRYYSENAFVGGVGALFDEVRRFDPAGHTSPLLDDQLWRYKDQQSNWWLPATGEAQETGDLDERRGAFEARKRRAYFEHRGGESILRNAGKDVEKMLRDLVDLSGVNPSRVVRLLNRFYNRGEERSEGLHLWVTHRYDARPSRFAAARWHVSTNDLEILVPKLRPDLAEAFPEYQPDHVVLVRKGDAPGAGLRIDKILLEALFEADQGQSSSFRGGEPGVRIATFYDRLAKHEATGDKGRIAEVRVVDIDTGASMRVAVDLKDRKYVHP
jgi:hypothetical protein